MLLGIDPETEWRLAWSIRRATYYAGTTVEARLKEMRPVLIPTPEPPPHNHVWSQEQKWTYLQAVGKEPPPPDATGVGNEPQPLPELDPDAAALLDGISS